MEDHFALLVARVRKTKRWSMLLPALRATYMILASVGWKNHPGNSDEKIVQTLDAQIESLKFYFSEISSLATNTLWKKEPQAVQKLEP